jgi:glycosyltransferase involved in cell wall biosynthesis
VASVGERSLLVVVPALNEEGTVGTVVAGLVGRLDADVLVVDDGSTDRTAALARAAGALVLRHPYNLGVGAALRSGFRFARLRGYERVLQVDGDGQHDLDATASLLERLDTGECDLVVGSRFESGYRVGRVRRFAMQFLSNVVSRRLGVHVPDTTSGFRAFGPAAVERFAASYPSAYLSDTVEALLLAADWGLRVEVVPVVMHPRTAGVASAGPLRSAVMLLRLLLVVALHRVRRPVVAQEVIYVAP